MDETNNQIDPVDNNINDNSYIEDDDSDVEDDEDYSYITLDKKVLQRLPDPSVTAVNISFQIMHDDGESYFKDFDWKEDGDRIANNTHLKRLKINYEFGSKHILGEDGENLPTQQQLQDFFSCIYRNRTIKALSFRSITIANEFGGSLIEGLQAHPNLKRIEIEYGRLGSIGLTAVGKVLSHTNSKLEELRLSNCYLNDEDMRHLTDSLLGNSRMRKLCLNNNSQISSVGWRALSTVIRHPKCKLTKLSLSWNNITDEGAIIVGGALSGSSVKALDLCHNKSISIIGWQTLLNQLSETSVEHLNLTYNDIGDDGLTVLASISTLKSLDMYNSNESVSFSGWQTFFTALQTRRMQFKKLNLSYNNIANGGIDVLGSVLSISGSALKILDIDGMSYSNGSGGYVSITPRGWQRFFTTLQDSNLNLVKLNLGSNTIDDEGIRVLIRVVSSMTSLKYLNLGSNIRVTPTGWQALSGFFQSPNFALETLGLSDNNIDDDTLIGFTNALTQNTTLKMLGLYQESASDSEDTDDDIFITGRGWAVITTLLCNKSSIVDTYHSNHTLCDVSAEVRPDDLLSYLELNKNEDKTEVARQKILQTHFSDDTTSNIQDLLGMDLEAMPIVMAWAGRPPVGWSGMNVSGLSLMYSLLRRVPDLFDSSAQKKSGGSKRKRDL